MFAPPPHLKSSGKNSGNVASQSDSKIKAPVRSNTRDRKNSGEEESEFAEWSRPYGFWETTINGDMGVKEWSSINSSSQAKQESPQTSVTSWPTTSVCSCLITSDPNEGLSKYLRHLKALLSRNKAMSASPCTPAIRYHHSSSTAFFRQSLTSSAPSTVSVKRKQAGSSHYRGSCINGTSSAASLSMIPCKNYNKLHKHSSFSDHQNCSRQAKLDNQHRSYSQGDVRVHRLHLPPTHKSPSDPLICPWLEDKDDTKELVASHEPEHGNPDVDIVSDLHQTPNPRASGLDEKERAALLASQHSTMQEYVEKYYAPSSKISRSTLPVIAEKDQRLVENIINYRHTSTRERETVHKNRYMQLTATDIRKTTALLLKTSMNKNSAKQRAILYPEADSIDSIDSITTPVGVTLAQLMGPKAAAFRTPPKSEVVTPTSQKAVMPAEGLSRVGTRWQIPRYQ
ncbi:uncharacterized protein [Watersipora subatra]